MLGEVVVKFRRDPFDLGQPRTGDVGKVVVLHVVADVEGDVVPGSVVGVGLVSSVEHVVLGNEVCRHGVDPQAEDGANQQIEE